MNVYKVNDCDWVAAKTFEEAKEWYLNEFSLKDDECWFEEECSLEDNMWVDISDLSVEELNEAHEIKDGMVRKSFKWVMEHIYNNQKTPYHIASTEY